MCCNTAALRALLRHGRAPLASELRAGAAHDAARHCTLRAPPGRPGAGVALLGVGGREMLAIEPRRTCRAASRWAQWPPYLDLIVWPDISGAGRFETALSGAGRIMACGEGQSHGGCGGHLDRRVET